MRVFLSFQYLVVQVHLEHPKDVKLKEYWIHTNTNAVKNIVNVSIDVFVLISQ